MAIAPDGPISTGLRQLRHDLLNPVNVLMGACGALTGSNLDDSQRAWVRMIESATRRVQGIIDDLESYRHQPAMDGQARLADLCSIAAARVGKPFDRARLVDAVERVAGRGRLRVLLVDDSPDLATLVRTYLKDTGWDLDIVETGERAVAQATSERYDVVLMDIDLPGLDGATAAHAIRAADLAHGASPTPIIAMTAFDPDTSSPSVRQPDTSSDADVVHIDDPEIAPLVPLFLEHRKTEVGMYRAALADGEFARIQSAAHKMKGTGRGYGLDVISRIGGELEVAAHEKDVPLMTRLIDELDGYLQRVRISM
ncbi:MAG TPA: response regulator [Vicinamibacterales bacterium]|nr:response regulator [Vicinamibacterales bacterium]